MSRSGAATRQRIMDAAFAVVMDRGFAATSVDAIQEAAGISRGTFFYHFPTKDDLSRALIERYARQDAELTSGLMARAEKLATDPLQQALLFLALHEELFESPAGELPGCLFASYAYEAGLFDDGTRAVVNDSIEHWRAVFGGKIQQALDARPGLDADAKMLADMAYGMFQGAFILSRVERQPQAMVAHLQQFRTLLESLFR